MRNVEHSIEPAPGRSVTRRLVGSAAMVALALLAGCRGAEPGEPHRLETVDVAPALDIDPEGDQRAVERAPELVGLLPSDFPKDVPLYLPASLVDFGKVEGGWRYVSLLSPHSRSRIERELRARVSERGWASAAGAAGATVLSKGGRKIRLYVEDANPGTVYRFEYSR